MSQLEREIAEQPEAIGRLLAHERPRASQLAALLRDDVRYVVIAARGSSDNAARYAQHVLGALCRLPVALATPSLYTAYGLPPRLDGALVLGISQSGTPADVIAVVAEGARQGRPTLAITNDPSSPLAQAAGEVLPMHAGEEIAVAATKTYTCSLAAIALLATSLAGCGQADLSALPDAVARQLERSGDEVREAELPPIDRLSVVGRGANYCTAFEIALKVRELGRVLAEAHSPPDLLHGPIGGLAPGHPVLVVVPDGPTRESATALLDALAERDARTMVASDADDLLARGDPAFRLERLPEWLSPLVAVIPGQLLAARVAAEHGRSLDQPEGLSKVLGLPWG